MERPEETYAVPSSSKKRKSVVWNDFDKVTIDGNLKAVCKNCEKQFDGSSKNGTTHLKNHLLRCSSTKPVETCKKMKNTCLEIANVEENFVFDDKRSHLDMARMIIMHGYSLDMVKHEYFKIFLKNLQPSFKLLPQDALKDNILRVYKEEKKKLYEYLGTLSCHFNLIIQFSTCHRKKNVYCCLVLQFIEDGLILNKKILALKQVDQCHDLAAETLFETVKGMLLEWNIDNKLCSITLSSSQSDKMVPNLKIWLDLARKLPLCGYFFHVHCTTDILNRLCQDGLKEVDGIIGKRMNNAKYVKEERLHWELNFDQTQEQHYFQGKYSVSPRLDSVLLKLDALMEKNQFLLDCDVVVVSEFSKLLHVVSSISGRKCLTINVYFHHICGIHFKILELQKSKHQDICKIADEMKMKFDKYFDKCGTGLAIASILDPSKNWKYVTYAFNECYGKELAQTYLTTIENALKKIFDNYEKELGKQASSSSGATHTGSIFTSYPDISNYDKLNRSWREEETCRDTKVASRNELKQYLAKPCIPVNGEFDILDWWRTNGKEFPILRKMALDILGIPMSMDYDFNIEDNH